MQIYGAGTAHFWVVSAFVSGEAASVLPPHHWLSIVIAVEIHKIPE